MYLAGSSYLEFSKGLSFQSELCVTSVPCKYLQVYVLIQVYHYVSEKADGGLNFRKFKAISSGCIGFYYLFVALDASVLKKMLFTLLPNL